MNDVPSGRIVKAGLWIWPADPRAQNRTLKRLAESPRLIAAMTAIAKSKTGLSNSELDDTLSDNSNWMTLWMVRQLTALGFVEFVVDLFGGPAKYRLSELGMASLRAITGQPTQPKATAAPLPAAPPQATPKAA